MIPRISPSYVLAAIGEDTSPNSGWVTERAREVRPRELFIDHDGMGIWIRASGHHVTGWVQGLYSASNFGPITAWRIRRAVRRWERRNPQGANP